MSKKFIVPMLQQAQQKSLDVYLETANDSNVQIYQKMGFGLSDKVQQDNIALYFMRIVNAK